MVMKLFLRKRTGWIIINGYILVSRLSSLCLTLSLKTRLFYKHFAPLLFMKAKSAKIKAAFKVDGTW